jgi:hypothetical protein
VFDRRRLGDLEMMRAARDYFGVQRREETNLLNLMGVPRGDFRRNRHGTATRRPPWLDEKLVEGQRHVACGAFY